MSTCQQPSGPAQDKLFSHLSTEGSLTSCRLAVRRVQPRVVTLTEQAGTTGVYELTPDGSRTIYRFSGPIRQNTTMTFNVNTSSSRIGDEMIWMLTVPFTDDSPSPLVTLQFGPTLYFNRCNSVASSLPLFSWGSESTVKVVRWVQYWTFDGEAWAYTGDNC